MSEEPKEDRGIVAETIAGMFELMELGGQALGLFIGCLPFIGLFIILAAAIKTLAN